VAVAHTELPLEGGGGVTSGLLLLLLIVLLTEEEMDRLPFSPT